MPDNIAELEYKRDYYWKLYMYYSEKLTELREPEEAETQEWKEEVHRIAESIGKNVNPLCECGCSTFWVSVTDKNPKEGVCCRCRKTVYLSNRPETERK